MKKEECSYFEKCSINEIQNVMLTMMIDIDKVCQKYNIDYWLSDGTLLGAIRHKGFIPWDDDMDICMTYNSFTKFMKVAPNELGEKYFIQNYETDDKYDIVGVHTKIRDKHSIFIEEWNKDYHQGAYIDIFIMNQFKNNDIIYKIQKEFYRMQSISLLPISQFDSFSKRNLKKILKIIFLRLDNQKLIRKLEKKDLNHKQEGDMFSYSFSTPMSIKYQFSEKDIFPLQRSEYEGHQFLIPKNSDKILRCLFNDYMKIPDESNRHGHALFFAIKNQQKNNT